MQEIDTSELESGLNDIAKILDQSESDGDAMRQMLWDIKDRAEDALLAFRKAKAEALAAENERLRKELRG